MVIIAIIHCYIFHTERILIIKPFVSFSPSVLIPDATVDTLSGMSFMQKMTNVRVCCFAQHSTAGKWHLICGIGCCCGGREMREVHLR